MLTASKKRKQALNLLKKLIKKCQDLHAKQNSDWSMYQTRTCFRSSLWNLIIRKFLLKHASLSGTCTYEEYYVEAQTEKYTRTYTQATYTCHDKNKKCTKVANPSRTAAYGTQ